jgi:peptidoglycan biosynthesis protein MviN/MurJ (putative lipid II flippase)
MAVFGLGGIALAAATAKALKVLALLFLFGRRVPAFRLASLAPFVGQMTLASMAAAAALAAWQAWGPRLHAGGLLSVLFTLAGGALLGGGAFIAVAYLLSVHELRDLWQRGKTWCLARMPQGRA